jgi:hypothetical protein
MRCSERAFEGERRKIPPSRKIPEKWGTPRLWAFALAATLSQTFVLAQEKPVSYDLKVKIEPRQGYVAVRGKIRVPVEADAKTLQFGLHETFQVKKLRVNGGAATFTFQAAEPSPLFPAKKNVVVSLPSAGPVRLVELQIDYAGKLKEIPEFGTDPDQKIALDDQINARMVELANYSSWYPEFGMYGHPTETTLEVSLPDGWTAICSGKKLEQRQKAGRAITRWLST